MQTRTDINLDTILLVALGLVDFFGLAVLAFVVVLR